MVLKFHTYETKLSSQRPPKATLIDLSLGRGIVLLSHKTFHTFVGSMKLDRM